VSDRRFQPGGDLGEIDALRDFAKGKQTRIRAQQPLQAAAELIGAGKIRRSRCGKNRKYSGSFRCSLQQLVNIQTGAIQCKTRIS
jgi:hypothetical protein